MFFLGLFWKRINATGAVWGLTGGFILGMAKLTIQTFFGKGKIESPAFLAQIGDFNYLYATGLLFAASAIIMVVASLMTPPPPPEKIQRPDLRLHPPRGYRRDQAKLGYRQQGPRGRHRARRALAATCISASG